MESLDTKILRMLQNRNNASAQQIADELHISKSACWRRIQRLEKTGVIKGRVVLLNAQKIGLGLTVYISIRTNQHNESWAEYFKTVVSNLDEILEVHRMSGDLDYLIKAVVTDISGYDRLYQQIIKADLFDVSSSFVMEEIKSTTELPLNQLLAHKP